MIMEMHQPLAWIVWPTITVVCAGLDAMFCGLETGIYVINKNRLDLQAEAGVPAARFLQRMLRKPDSLLAVLLIGTNLTRYLATFSITAMFVLAGREAHAEWYTLLVATPLLFVIGDSVPKSIFQRLGAAAVYRLTWLLKAAGILFRITGLSGLVIAISSALMKLTSADRRPTGTLGHDGLAAVVAEGHASGVLTHFQSIMADRVMRIADVKVSDVMIPMQRVVAAPRGVGREELIEIIRAKGSQPGRPDSSTAKLPTRLVILDQAGQVLGTVNVCDVLTAEDQTTPVEVMVPPLILQADLTVTDALYQMRRKHRAMAVVERDGGHVGIVTIKDLVEEIVGELEAW